MKKQAAKSTKLGTLPPASTRAKLITEVSIADRRNLPLLLGALRAIQADKGKRTHADAFVRSVLMNYLASEAKPSKEFFDGVTLAAMRGWLDAHHEGSPSRRA